MANKEIVWSNNAKNELRKILEFYNERNGSKKYSLKILSETEEILKTLSKSEFIGRLTSNKKTRVIPMKVYLIFYEINENTIEVISFWDNRQNEKKRRIK
ncbi:type II toxin-antitoxin system RelE/ParE family toxin [Polaribacter sp. WD7]|uniref:type II toxin-antitoxin system RelE/ParE family toxin n=1 Tax=Polaribacter sp. WD7 TaxID=2269061 RepID=UPI000DF2FC84|nr:type II toxin-antitoxin system RelE/ParE family toxin [Polaribacter sp. WD7]RCS28523.1 type II toxin-antitoxin system RelE/ParE family toxin [Polaribacter sp. WD7]